MATGGVVKVKVDYRVGETPGESIRFLNVDTRGADPEAIAKLKQVVSQQRLDFGANIGSITAGTIRTRNGIEMDMQAKEWKFHA